jgi:type II restriction/modification system DNA methylase subunit YeeA
MEYCHSLLDSGNNNEELYRYILFQQSNALAKPLPMLFSNSMEYLEYFIPTPLLFGDTIINRLIEIDEDDFKEDVEIIGWLYQFYVSSLREETRKKKKTEKNDIPILSQIFTPDWIVRYMAENSVGRIWLESYPQSRLKEKMKYFVDEAEQEPEVLEQLETIKYKNVNPKEIRIIEPACGSGHILVYVFELLFEMYLEKGYLKKDIPQLIFINNLYGLDIDQRSTQLASFALTMKARSIDNKFFEQERIVKPRVYEIIDSKSILSNSYNGKSYLEILKDYNDSQWQGENHLTDEELQIIKYVVELFEDAKIIGSLLKVKPFKFLVLRKKLALNVIKHTQTDIFTSAFFDYEFKELLDILRIAHIMSTHYDVMITNPPYIGISKLENDAKIYLSKNYPNSKTDMFAMFMEVTFVKKNGFRALVNPDSWMFLRSYEKLRKSLINLTHFISMAHHGMGEFDAVVQTTSFIIRNCKLLNYNGVFFRLIDSKNKENDFLYRKSEAYFANAFKFINIPGTIIGFWASDNLVLSFKSSKLLGDLVVSRNGMKTGRNDMFVRYWWEVSYPSSNLRCKTHNEAIKSGSKWFPYNKGGDYRKWYGNNDFVVDWQYGGRRIFDDARKDNRFVQDYPNDFKFIPIVSWSKISTGKPAFRYKESCISDIAGMSLYTHDGNLKYYLGLCNSKVPEKILSIIAPTLNFESGQIGNIPVLFRNESIIEEIVNKNISLSKKDWDSYESSWDFQKHPLSGNGKLSFIFSAYKQLKRSEYLMLKNNEEEINEYFINLYGLQNELTKVVDDKYVSISVADKLRDIKSLISYLIGVLMGRYSLAGEGLIYAGGTFDPSRYGNYDVDEDGIIPLFSDLSFENGLVHRIIGLIKDVYGEEYYRDNIDFIADALGKKANETSEETLNRYLNNDFYSDHIKIYQKRPIYWMFSSGKKDGFKALVYLHRYNSNTLAKMNASYFQPATTVLRTRISEVEKLINTASDREKVQLERTRFSLVEQLNEAIEYGQVLDYMANKYISIDLDDGVKENYQKFQKIEINTSHGKVKKDLLIPIK